MVNRCTCFSISFPPLVVTSFPPPVITSFPRKRESILLHMDSGSNTWRRNDVEAWGMITFASLCCLYYESSWLDISELLVGTIGLGKKFVMTSLLYDSSIMHHDDPIHFHNGRKPMSDNDSSFVFHDFIHRFLDQMFWLRIEWWGCFIEDKDPFIFENRSCDSDSLPFSSWQLYTSFSYQGIIAVV